MRWLIRSVIFQMIWLETPTNPLMQIVDISAVCKVARTQKDIIVVVDNTFATAYFQVHFKPLIMQKYIHLVRV